MPRRNSQTFILGVTQLESREVPAIIGTPTLSGSVLTVTCDNTPSNVLVMQNDTGLQVRDVIANRFFSYAPGTLTRIDVFGGNGGDSITGRGFNGVRLRMFGGGGDDKLYGSPGRDVMQGGA